jgi:predicted phosphoribosyltransferase
MRRFQNRDVAGQQLAEKLYQTLGSSTAAHRSALQRDCLVLALPRGALIIGRRVAERLGCGFDILASRKVCVPNHEEYACGAITARGFTEFEESTVRGLHISSSYIEKKSQEQMKVAQQREADLRGGRPAEPIKDKIVMIVDDGIATGMTMRAAIKDVKAQQPKRLIVAAPVGAAESVHSIKSMSEVDDVVVLSTPRAFHAVGLWYQSFDQVEDADAKKILLDYRPPVRQANTEALRQSAAAASAGAGSAEATAKALKGAEAADTAKDLE